MKYIVVAQLILLLWGCGTLVSPPNPGPTTISVDENQFTVLPNGLPVHAKRMVVYLFIGHSNMALPFADPQDTLINDHTFIYHIPGFETIRPLGTEIQTDQWIENFASGGPVAHFLRQIAAGFPDYYFGVVQNARSAASVAEEYHSQGELTQQMLEIVDSLKGHVTFGGIVCMLGIMEAVLGPRGVLDSIEDFAPELKKTIDTLRSVTASPMLPLYIGELEKGGGGLELWPYALQIDAQIKQLVQNDQNATLISSEAMNYIDPNHYDLPSMQLWADRLAALVISDPSAFFLSGEDPVVAPQRLRVVFKTDSLFTIAWDPAYIQRSYADHYIVSTAQQPPIVLDGAQHHFTSSTSAQPVSVALVNAQGLSSDPLSIDLGAKGNTKPLPIPVIDSITGISDSAATIHWHHTGADAASGVFDLWINGGKARGDITGSLVVNNLVSGTEYRVSIRYNALLREEFSFSDTAVFQTLAAEYVDQLPLQINCGGAAYEGFLADTAAFSSTAAYGYLDAEYKLLQEGAVDTVFNTARSAEVVRYAFRLQEPGLYKLTTWYNDLWGKSHIDHLTVIAINGVRDSIYNPGYLVEPDGTPKGKHAYQHLIEHTGRLLKVDFFTIENSTALVSGLRLERAAVLEVVYPTDSTTLQGPDSLQVAWYADYFRSTSVSIEIRPENGLLWQRLTRGYSIAHKPQILQNHKVYVDPQALGIESATRCRIRIVDYANTDLRASSGPFLLQPGGQ